MEPFAASPAVVGHRGAPRLARENTPESFAAAAAAGASWVELDARPCADGLVVHHDPCTPDGVALVARTTAALADRGVAELCAALAGLPPGLGVDIEVKNARREPGHDPTGGLARRVAVVAAAAARDRPVCTSSFDVATVRTLVAGAPDVPAGLLLRPAVRASEGVKLAAATGARLVCPHVVTPRLSRAYVEAAHAAGLAVLVWTVDRPSRARALAAAGVDALCTNDPPGLVAALEDHRQVTPPA